VAPVAAGGHAPQVARTSANPGVYKGPVDGRPRRRHAALRCSGTAAGARTPPEGAAATTAPMHGASAPWMGRKRATEVERPAGVAPAAGETLRCPAAAGRALVAPGAPAKPNIFKVARQWEGGSAVGAVNLNDWRTDAIWSGPSTSVPGTGGVGQSVTSSAGAAVRPGGGGVLRHAEAIGDQPSRSRDWPSGTTRSLRRFGAGRNHAVTAGSPADAAATRQRWSDFGSAADSRRLSRSADRTRSGGSRPPRCFGTVGSARAQCSLRRQRDRRPLAEPTGLRSGGFAPGSVGVAHDWRGRQRSARLGASAPGNGRT
jgi:hypothetical protein